VASLYKAFISYSHAADGKLAPALQRGIQRLGKPWFRRPAIRVFRDETSLSADPGLWSGIQRALEQCEFFLLMASRLSAASPWTQKEVEWWLRFRSTNHLFIVVTDGEIVWNSAAADFDWQQTTCLPAVLRGQFHEEPHYVDLRWAKGRADLSLRNARFRSAVLTLAAPIHGRPMDELDGEDIRQQRLLRLTAGVALIAVSTLAFVSMLERRSAKEQTRMAESRSMAAKSIDLLSKKGGVDKAILLAVLAWRLSPTDEARDAMSRLESAAYDIASITGQSPGGGIDELAFRPMKEQPPLLATAGGENVILLWHIPDGSPAEPPIASDQTDPELIFSADGAHLLTHGSGAPTPDDPNHKTVELHDLRSGATRLVPTDASHQADPGATDPGTITLSPDGHLVAFASRDRIVVWDSATGSFRYKTLPHSLIGLHFVGSATLAFVTEEHSSYHPGFQRGFWDLGSDAVRIGPSLGQSGLREDGNTVTFSNDGSKMVIWGFNDSQAFVYRSRDGLTLEPIPLPGNVQMKDDIRYSVAFDAEGDRVAIAGNQLAAWDLAANRLLKVVSMGSGGKNDRVGLSGDGRWMAGTEDGKVVVWDLNAANPKDPKAPAGTVDVTCSLSGNDQRECIRRLCEKVSPLISDKTLSDALGNYDFEQIKQTALRHPCATQ
jgi:hypothetical protein